MADSDDETVVFKRNLRDFREAEGMTQLQLAIAADLSTGSIHRYETGKGLPEREALRSLARVFGRPTEDFFNPEPPPRDPSRQVFISYLIRGDIGDGLMREVEEYMRQVNRRAQAEALAARDRAREGKKL